MDQTDYGPIPRELEAQLQTAGVCILFDVIGSTKLKKDFQETWRKRFETFYEKAWALAVRLEEGLPHCQKSVVKNLGDGVMIFIPTEQGPKNVQRVLQKAEAWRVFDEVQSFWAFLASKFSGLQIKVKTVITSLNDIYYIDGDNPRDVLGRGIDFTFRLERFGDSSHFVVNEAFANELDLATSGKERYLEVECLKYVKGWDTPQGFRLITNLDWIEATYGERNPDERADNVYLELFKVYLEHAPQDDGEELEKALEKILPEAEHE